MNSMKKCHKTSEKLIFQIFKFDIKKPSRQKFWIHSNNSPKTFGSNMIKIENSNFKKSALVQTLKEFHKVLKTLSEVSDVLVKFSISNTFEFFLCIIRHPYTYLKCFKHSGEWARKKSNIIRCVEQIIFHQTQPTAIFKWKPSHPIVLDN